jgi:hypothetical protein
MTTAQQIAERFGNDGTRFEDAAGISFQEACRCAGADVTWRDGQRNVDGALVRYEFMDGSALIEQFGYCWDLAAPGCSCGYCMAGNGVACRG